MMRVHGTCVAIDGVGVLLRGPSGAGKSDLALRLIDRGASLVADDQVLLDGIDGRLVARAPEALFGRIEVRGVGILDVPAVASAAVGLLVDLVPPEAVERLPERRRETLAGVTLPVLRLTPFEASAATKVRLAARPSAADITARY